MAVAPSRVVRTGLVATPGFGMSVSKTGAVASAAFFRTKTVA